MMISSFSELFALLNDILQAVIVAFGVGVLFYTLTEGIRDQVTAAFFSLITFVCVVFFTELMASRIIDTVSTETWLRVQWVGIAFVPAAQFHLSSGLLTITGAPPNRRRFLIPATYVLGTIFFGLVLGSDLIVSQLIDTPFAPHLLAGPIFYVFAVYFWLITAASIYNVWRARQRCITRATRGRMTSTLLAFLAAPLAVFPYLLIAREAISAEIPVWLWPLIIVGNLVVGVMFSILTVTVTYFGAISPDRVVWVRLVKFMARVPLSGSLVLLAYVLTSRLEPFLGLRTETVIGFSVVAAAMLVQWGIHVFKRPLERLFQLNDDPDVRRIQLLSERLLTTRDLKQYLETILAVTCETLRTPAAFITAVTPDGPRLESVVGALVDPDAEPSSNKLSLIDGAGLDGMHQQAGNETHLFAWQDFWIRPLYNRDQDFVLGVLGIRARSPEPDFTEKEADVFQRLSEQAAAALEDRILQREVFGLVEGLLPQITKFQERKQAARFGSLPAFTQQPDTSELLSDPDFSNMVRDALTHYWGGPKLTQSPLLSLEVVRRSTDEYEGNPTKALRAILDRAIDLQKPDGERKMTTAEWILYNILELKFVQGLRVRDVARRLAMSESDLYRKQRVAIENVAQAIALMEKTAVSDDGLADTVNPPVVDPHLAES